MVCSRRIGASGKPSMHRSHLSDNFVILTTLAALERSQTQWTSLLAQAELEVLQQKTYNADTSESIQVVRPRT
jgi:hypothetical protein